MAMVHCPSCGEEILDLEQVVVTDTEENRNFHHQLLYELVKKEEERLQKQDISGDYRLCKALAACFELQDYLSNCITTESPEDY